MEYSIVLTQIADCSPFERKKNLIALSQTKCIHVPNSVNLYREFTKRTIKT